MTWKINPTTGLSYEYPNFKSDGTASQVVTPNQFYDHSWSATSISGLALTDNGDGTVDIASGESVLQPTATDGTQLICVTVPAKTGLAITDNSVNYVYADYNSGTPQVAATTSIDGFNCRDKCLIYIVSREGTDLHIVDARSQGVNSNIKHRRALLEIEFMRHSKGGTQLSNPSGLTLSVTAGAFWFGLAKTTHLAFDTSVAGTGDYNIFRYYYRAAISGWTKVIEQKSIDNTKYDDGSGTLATLNNNKYKVDWIYLLPNTPSIIAVVYGQAEYANVSEARAALPPSEIPPIISGAGALIGRVILEKSAATFYQIDSSLVDTFNTSTAISHNGLSGLQGGTLAEYYHLTSAEYTGTGTGVFVKKDSPTITTLATIDGQLIVPKTTGYGIKVDVATPTFPWKDMLGEIFIKSPGANDPTLSAFIGTVSEFSFSNAVLNEANLNFHIPHDYMAGSDIYLHFHWAQNVVDTGGTAGVPGSCKWQAEVTYAKGHNQAAFITPVTTSVTQTASGTQYQHMIAEVQLSAASPSASQIDSDNLEPDGIIGVRVYRDPADVADTLNQVPFLIYTDIHYMTTNIGTKAKSPNFYV